MTSIFFSPQYVNREKPFWAAGPGPSVTSPSGEGFNALGATLDLIFVDMDTSYSTGSSLDLRFDGQNFYEWEEPAEPQGTYYVWSGFVPWEPSLDLYFSDMDTSYETGASLDLTFTTSSYKVFELPPDIQGQYLQFEY